MLIASVAALAVLSSCRKELSDVKKPETSDKSVPSLQNSLPETSAANFKAVESAVSNNVAGYYVGLPARYDSTSKNYPLLIFVHGINELASSGKSLSTISSLGINRFLSQKSFPASFDVNGQSFSFIVAAPQFKEWPSASDLNGFVDFMAEKYRIDASRVYVVGLSMGGGVTWDFTEFHETGIVTLSNMSMKIYDIVYKPGSTSTLYAVGDDWLIARDRRRRQAGGTR